MKGFWSRATLSPLQLGLIAAASVAATALVIVAGLGRTPAQSAALAALRTRPFEVRMPENAPAQLPVSSAPVTPPLAPASSGATANPAPSPSPQPVAPTTPLTPSLPAAAPTKPLPHRPKISHVFVIALTTPSYDAAFGTGSVAHYLNRKLVPRGTLLGGYETLGPAELPDYLALISGQAPNGDTSNECPTYDEFPAGTQPARDGQVPGSGCVYPNTALTIADQVTAAGHQWRAYIDGMGSSTCSHPDSGAAMSTVPAGAGPDYALLHNPFIYFHSLLDLGGCAADDVSLNKLPHDLAKPAATPTYAFIAPGACLDAAAMACPPGVPAGLAGEDSFLHTWVPRIFRSRAYKHGGALIITFALPDAGPSPGATAVTGSAPTGALLLSPHAAHGRIVSKTFTPYSVLRTVEQLLGYKPLGHARGARSFAAYLVG